MYLFFVHERRAQEEWDYKITSIRRLVTSWVGVNIHGDIRAFTQQSAKSCRMIHSSPVANISLVDLHSLQPDPQSFPFASGFSTKPTTHQQLLPPNCHISKISAHISVEQAWIIFCFPNQPSGAEHD